MPLESSLKLPQISRREFLRGGLAMLAVGFSSSCVLDSKVYEYDGGFLADPRFNTGGELEHLVTYSRYPTDRVSGLVLTSREAFMNAPVEEWKDRLPKGKVTVLYPGAGVHIMPLQLGYSIMEQNSEVDEVEFIYTEIDPDSLDGFEYQLSILRAAGLVGNIGKSEKNYPDQEPRSMGERLFGSNIPHETIYSFDIFEPSGKSHRISVVYAFRDPSKFFEEEYARRANILISHDSEGGSQLPKDMVEAALKVEGNNQLEGRHDLILLSEPEFIVGSRGDYRDPDQYGQGNSFEFSREEILPFEMTLVRGKYGCDSWGARPAQVMMMMYFDRDIVNSARGQETLSTFLN